MGIPLRLAYEACDDTLRYGGSLSVLSIVAVGSIDTGPYRLVRHPSYAGALLAFAGLGLLTGNAISLALFVVPITAAYLYRIGVEEAAALRQGIGDAYVEYSARTARLVPGMRPATRSETPHRPTVRACGTERP